MTKRDPHSDNELIDEMQEEGAVSQGGRAGGGLARDVGTRAEMKDTGGLSGERPHAQNHPQTMNEAKGEKTTARLQPGSD
jgi:hypothetical protein